MKLGHLLLSLTMISACQSSQAETIIQNDWLPDQFKMNVFGTIGASYHNQPGLAYRPSIETKDAVEASKLDFATGSLLGGQLSYLLNDQFSGTLQMVARNNAWGNYRPEVAAAYVKYAPSESWNFRAGRISSGSILLAGDSRFAGYSYTSVRPSPEIFGLFASYDRFDGIDVYYRRPLGEGILGLRANYGSVVGYRYLNDVSEQIKDGKYSGLMASWQTEALELKAFWASFDFNNFKNYNPLAARLSTFVFSPSAQLRAQQIYAANNYEINAVGLGLEYEFNPWKLQMIGMNISTSSFPGYQGDSGLVMLSRRSGQFTPYVSLAYSRFKPDASPLQLPALPALQPVVNAYDTVSSLFEIKQSTLSMGLRYDINDHYAFKMQVDKINADAAPTIFSSGSNRSNKDLALLTFTLDFFY